MTNVKRAISGRLLTLAHRSSPSVVEDRPDLSVVFVTRNEAERIEACITTTMESVEVARQEGRLHTVEYLLVDSASTDGTVDIAARFPVGIIKLDATWPLSCAAGCHVGLLRARGTWTAIINGDMTVDQRYFADIFPYLKEDIGAVTGVAKENVTRRTVIERLLFHYRHAPLSLGELPREIAEHPGGYSTGTFLVRTAAARQVGSYNPFLKAAEDTDLRCRLILAGWRVLDLPVLQGLHYWASRQEPLDLLAYFSTAFRNSVGLGQMARYNSPRDSWVTQCAVQPVLNARALINGLTGLAFAILLLLNLLAILGQHAVGCALALLTDGIAAGLVALDARKQRLRLGDSFFSVTWYRTVFTFVRIAGFLKGFLSEPRGPSDYPASAERLLP